jgi:hypothetical protein
MDEGGIEVTHDCSLKLDDLQQQKNQEWKGSDFEQK